LPADICRFLPRISLFAIEIKLSSEAGRAVAVDQVKGDQSVAVIAQMKAVAPTRMKAAAAIAADSEEEAAEQAFWASLRLGCESERALYRVHLRPEVLHPAWPTVPRRDPLPAPRRPALPTFLATALPATLQRSLPTLFEPTTVRPALQASPLARAVLWTTPQWSFIGSATGLGGSARRLHLMSL
jgi:hypothetical protein